VRDESGESKLVDGEGGCDEKGQKRARAGDRDDLDATSDGAGDDSKSRVGDAGSSGVGDEDSVARSINFGIFLFFWFQICDFFDDFVGFFVGTFGVE